MDIPTGRAWAWHKQGLDGSLLSTNPAEVLSTTGWARSIGGANSYLTLFARGGTRRAHVDAAVARLEIHELPVVRGCTYVLGGKDFAWGLQLGAPSARAELRVMAKLGVSEAQLRDLGEQVLEALGGTDGLSPAELKDVLGSRVINLGEAGKKKGAATTLPAALGILQTAGKIRRVPVNGRLDQQRYTYVLWGLEPSGLSDEEARAEAICAYLGWTGGATLKETQWFSGFTVAQSKAALTSAGAVETDGLWQLTEDAAAAENFRRPEEEQVQLLAGSDSLFLLRRNALSLIDDVDLPKVMGDGSALTADLPDHAIVDRGRIIGLWQYDPGAERVVYKTFARATKAVKTRVAEVEEYIREDLGDFRSFSLDSPASRKKRIDALSGG